MDNDRGNQTIERRLIVGRGIRGRHRFGHLLTKRKLLGEAVEVGTAKGCFADMLLKNWEGQILYCIDPWFRKDDFAEAKRVLRRHGRRCKLIVGESADVVGSFSDNSLDFVYIDANHQIKHIHQDIHLWWPKIKPGGILAGHDFIGMGNPENDTWATRIQPVVFAFAEGRGLVIRLVPEDGANWSFYLDKPHGRSFHGCSFSPV